VQDFVLDTTKINDVKGLKNTLANKNVKLVAYLDAAVSVKDRKKNPTYAAGNATHGGAFIKSFLDSKNPDGYLVNRKNGKNVVYIDWMNDRCGDFWASSIVQYSLNVPYDGLWTTMNEPYGDVAGELSTSTDENEEEQPFIDTPRELFSANPSGNETYDQSWFYSFWPLTQNSTYKLPFVPQF